METMDHDVAVLELKRALKLGPTMQPIALPASGEELLSGATAVVSGWGTLYVRLCHATFSRCFIVYFNMFLTHSLLWSGGWPDHGLPSEEAGDPPVDQRRVQGLVPRATDPHHRKYAVRW